MPATTAATNAAKPKVDLAALRKHIGTKIEDHDWASPTPLRCLLATFDRPESDPKEGDPVPPGYHLTYFPSTARPGRLALDGLPTDAGVLPKMPFPRRMYAGTNIAFHDTVKVGDKLRRETELTSIDLREGASGALIFTVQTRRIFTPRGLAIVEEGQTVFREEVPKGAKSGIPKREEPPAGLPWSRTHKADPVSLFRYSALTFNPHRIHYDRPYAMEVEGYPGLVVHGPYSQQLLIDLARDNMKGKRMTSFVQRARAPLFDTKPFTLVGRPTEAGRACEVWAVTPDGTIAMQATATFE